MPAPPATGAIYGSAASTVSAFQRLTDDTYTDRYPLWVNADTIAFESNRGGQLDLWRLSTATRKATQVTTGQTSEVPTGASADGSVVSFEEVANSVNLWRLDLPSGATRQLTGDALSDFWPSVSHDDGAVAFQRARPTPVEGFRFFDSRIQIARMTTDGLLEPQTVADGFSARLSADGRWVAYYQRIPDRAHMRLLAKNLTTGESRTLSDQCVLPRLTAASLPVDFTEQNATWSASGATLFYIVAGKEGHEIHAANVDTTSVARRPVVTAKGAELRDLRLSPDGEVLAFLVRTAGQGTDKPVFELRAHHLRDNRTVVVTRDQQAQPFLNLPGWARADAVILQRAARTATQLFELQLVEVGLDGTRRVLATVPDSVIPAVRVDAARERLFVTRAVNGIHNIHAMSLRDGTMRQLTVNQSPGVSFSGIQPLSADAVVFARDERKRDIWLVTTRIPGRSVERPLLKRKRGVMLREWKPSSEDATSLAALRWFANTIENFAIELYATDRESFPDIERVLRDTLAKLKGVKAQFSVPDEENGCPDGYVLCHGVCAPSCDDLESESREAQPASARAASASPEKSKKKKSKKR